MKILILSWQWLCHHDIVTMIMILWYYDNNDYDVMTAIIMTSWQRWIWQHEDNDCDIIMI